MDEYDARLADEMTARLLQSLDSEPDRQKRAWLVRRCLQDYAGACVHRVTQGTVLGEVLKLQKQQQDANALTMAGIAIDAVLGLAGKPRLGFPYIPSPPATFISRQTPQQESDPARHRRRGRRNPGK